MFFHVNAFPRLMDNKELYLALFSFCDWIAVDQKRGEEIKRMAPLPLCIGEMKPLMASVIIYIVNDIT